MTQLQTPIETLVPTFLAQALATLPPPQEQISGDDEQPPEIDPQYDLPQEIPTPRQAPTPTPISPRKSIIEMPEPKKPPMTMAS